MQSFVNIITTPKGGTHVTGFEQAIVKVFRRQLELNARRLKVGYDKPEKDDILAGMTAVVTVRLAEPQFEGQTKEVLGTNAVRAIVAKVVEQELTARLTSRQARRQGPGGPAAREGRLRDEVAHQRAAAQGDPAPQERPRELDPALQAARLPHDRRRALRAVHRRGRLGDGHRQGGPLLGVPGAAADPRQDPQRAEGVGERHAQERRVRLDHPGHRGRLGPQLRPRGRALRQGHHHDRRRRRRRPHPHAAAHPLLPLHASRSSTPGGSMPRCRRCTASRSSTPARRRTS